MIVKKLLPLFLAAAVLGQDDEAPRGFSLSSNQTYAPGEKAAVTVFSQGLGALEFRLYKVADPEKFFLQLEDPHHFGGRAPSLPKDATLLERFRTWKADWRYRMKSAFKAQFTYETQDRLRQSLFQAPAPLRRRLNEASFAQVPLLNSKQLIKKFKQPMTKANPWDSVTVPLDVTEPGIYLVEATNGDLRAYTIACISRHAMITKTAPGKIVAFVVDRTTGQPARNVDVVMRATRTDAPKTFKTNPSGLATGDFPSVETDHILVLAKPPGDFVPSALPGYAFAGRNSETLKGYVYTERPVYRPGHRVHFRAVLRTPTKEGYALPNASAADIEIQDSDGKTVSRQAGRVSSFGTVHADYEIPAGAPLGQYAVNVRLGGDYGASGSFEVEEYKKPEYFVKVTPAQKRHLQGTPIQAEIDARYFFGEPVKNAKVSYRILRYRYWAPWYADDLEEDSPDAAANWGGDEVGQGTGTLDDEGKLKITVANPNSEYDLLYRIEASVTDAANRAIDGTGYALATVGNFMLNVQPDSYVYAPGTPVRAQVEARDYDGKPVPNTKVSVTIDEYRWSEDRRTYLRTLAEATGTTRADGKAIIELTAPNAGSYELRVSSGAVKDNSWLWVNGGASEQFSYRRQQEEIQIVPDKKSYAPGETARLLIIAGQKNAHLLVSVEGRDLHTTQHLHAREGTATLEVPIREAFAPNFYVHAAFIQKGTLYQGTKAIKVPPLKQQVQIAVKPSKPEFKPGEQVTYSIETRDWQNKPVATEVALGVVDEAIYSVRPESTQDITKFFYGRVYSVVGTESSLSYYFYGEAGRRQMQLAALASSRALGALKEEPLARPKVRKLFPDTAYWTPALVTGADGRGSVSFTLPDNLTTWRTTARGVTAKSTFGQTIDKVLVRKNLMLRTAFPRFFTVGDEVTVKLLVQNKLAREKRTVIKLAANGLTLLDGNQRELSISSQGEGVAEFRVRADAILEEAVITAQALTDEESDAMEFGLPIKPFGVKMTSGQSGTGAQSLTLNIPAASNAREIEISVTPSVAGAMFGALDYLTQFPYGCTEQTMSSFLPNIIVSQALRDLQLKSTQNPADLEAKIKAGVDRLLDFQHPDGGWGWWKTDDSSAFMTALVIEGFARAEQAGRGTPEMKAARARGAQWLKASLARERNVTGDMRAYLAYALALHDPGTGLAVDLSGATFSPHGQAKLGLAYLAAGNAARAAQIAAELERSAQQDDAQAWWKNDRDGFMDYYYDTSPETTAAVLKLLAQVNPKNPLLPKIAQWLVAHRSDGYYWHSTKQTAIAIDGLTEYLRSSGELKPDYRVAVEVNGRNVIERSFSAADALAPVAPKIRIPAATANNIRITQSGNGRLYWSAQASWFSTEEKQEKAGSAKLNLLRDYFRLVPVPSGDRTVYRLEPLTGAVKSGDLLAARLTVTGDNWRYLLIEDPLPAGVETVEKDNLYELEEKPVWWRSWFDRRELRDDRVAIFKTHFSEGQSQFFYLFKVVNPGKFKTSPARVQPMYQPNYQATTESKIFEVTAQ